MVELNNIASIFETALNDNDCGINFCVSTDRGVYDAGRTNIDGFTVPGVVTALTGNYEPLRGLKVYTLPVNLELWCYAALEDEFYKPSYTLEQQKECVSAMVEALNGTTQVIDGDAVIFTGTTVTVGAPNNNGGGGCTRIPVLVQVVLTAVEGAVLFNDQSVIIDGAEVVFSSWSVGLTRQGESVTKVGTTVAKTLCDQMVRTFAGTAFMTKEQPFIGLQSEILSGEVINEPHTIKYTLNGTEYVFNVVLISATITGQSGSVLQINLTFAEAYGNA